MGNKNIFSKIKKNISKLLDSKILLILALFMIFITMLYFYIKPVESESKANKDYSGEIVAYIGNDKVTFREIEKRAEELFYIDKEDIIKNLGADVYKKELSKYVIYEGILYKKAKDEKITVTKEELNETYEELKEFLEKQLNLEDEEFEAKYANNEKKMIKSMRKTIKAYKYLDEKTRVDDLEARKYYDANKDKFKEGVYRDIFISTIDSSGKKLGKDEIKDAKNRAYDIYRKLEEGYDFEELEDKYSEDVKGTIPGGLGDLEMDFTDKDVRNKIFDLKEGEYIEKPLESSYGYHIVKRVGTEIEPFNKVKEEIKSMLTYKNQIKLIESLLKEYNVKFTEKYR